MCGIQEGGRQSLTVIVRVSGVGSLNPSESVTVKVTLTIPGLLKVITPGSSPVKLGNSGKPSNVQ